MPAADIGNSRSRFELLHHALKCRQAACDEVGPIPRTEELLGTDKQLRIVFVPAETLPAAESFGDRVAILER